MQQPEILSLAERLIPAYHADDFEHLLGQMTEGEPPSVKILIKMELNRVMAPCTKSIDLRGRVNGECREYQLDGLTHWLDDVAFNAYHKNTRKFGGYTEGVWEALCNTHNNFRVMKQRGQSSSDGTESKTLDVEAINLGYDLKRRENRLKISSQVELKLANNQLVHAVTVDLSPSGAKFKAPSAFDYKLGEVIGVRFVELKKTCDVKGIQDEIPYRIVAIDESYENDAIKFLRLLSLDDSNTLNTVLEQYLKNDAKKAHHDNQDRFIRARSRGFEHTYLKHTCNLPVFFNKNELKLALMTESNHAIWQYWQDERNQQTLTNLFNTKRLEELTAPGVKSSCHVLYSFTHEHKGQQLFFSIMIPEVNKETRQLFWHVGAKKESWKTFRLSVFQLSDEEKQELSNHSSELSLEPNGLTHCGILQEISDHQNAGDYLLTKKPKLPSNGLNAFRHPRNPSYNPICLYFETESRRREPRYKLKSPITITLELGETLEGTTLDLSKHGASIALTARSQLKAGTLCHINFKELQSYDKKLPLSAVPYKVIRVSPSGKQLQLAIIEESQTVRVIAFFGLLITHNQEKLTTKKELVPSSALLEGLHHILLDKLVSAPIFVEKKGSILRPTIIGISYPLPAYLTLFAKLGTGPNYSLEPIYKGRAATLLAEPMKRIENSEPHYHDLYMMVSKFGNRIQSIESKLLSDFGSVKERINFVKNARNMGEFYAIRICGTPVFDPMTAFVRKDLEELSQVSLHKARTLEKEISSIIGYGELTDITDEVLMRLELMQ